jgi:predicted RNase H-like HicB family nuclease
MEATCTAVIQQRGRWWIGWIEEVPGVNSQGGTREELLENLRSALGEALEMDRAADLEDERQWSEAFANSQDRLAELAAEAREEYRAGRTLDLACEE